MKKYFVAIAAIALFAFACTSGETSEATDDSAAACKPKPLNPNGDSELAILMREMADWTDSCKVAIESGRTMPAQPASLSALQTAKKTDETIDASIFNSMATLYQSKVSEFAQATDTDRKEYFNAMVGACVSCHQNFCQGPLVRINKMYVQ